jgi:tetratricopeptide (TPR) repeat protein
VNSYLLITLRWVRDWRGAMEALDRRRAITSSPDQLIYDWSHAQDEFRFHGNIDVLKQALAQPDTASERSGSRERLNFCRFEVAMLERDYGRAGEFLQQIPEDAFNMDKRQLLSPFSGTGKSFYEALLSVARDESKEQKELALERARKSVAAEISSRTDVPVGTLHANLAIIDAFMGRKQEALDAASQAITSYDERVARIEHNTMQAALALVYAQTGEAEKALDLIEHLVTVPAELNHSAIYDMTLTDLKWRWVWDPLRNHPRFQKLVAAPEPETVY